MPFEREGKKKCFKSPVTHNISYLLPKNMPRHTRVCRATDTLLSIRIIVLLCCGGFLKACLNSALHVLSKGVIATLANTD